MFNVNKQKNYLFYYKPSNVKHLTEFNYNKYNPKRNIYYIRCLKSGYLTVDPLKAIIRLYKWFSKNFKLEDNLKYKLYIFPDFILTSKPKEVRMGKGKGAILSKVAIIKRGQLVFSLTHKYKMSKLIFSRLLKKLALKLPFKAIITVND